MTEKFMEKEVQDMLQTTDAKIWAEVFVAHVKNNPEIATDEETMIGWFANAIMAGYDSVKNRRQALEETSLLPRRAVIVKGDGPIDPNAIAVALADEPVDVSVAVQSAKRTWTEEDHDNLAKTEKAIQETDQG